MKNTLLLIAILFTGVGFSQNVYFNEQDGNTSSYTIAEINKITFSSGSVIVDSKNKADEFFPISTFRHITFQPLIVTNLIIDNPSSILKVFPNPTNSTFFINSKEPLEKASIFDNKGNMVLTIMNPSEVDVSQLAAGQYHFVGYSESHVFHSTIVKY